jgi:diaminohydroxyphosphoribosylaminopyrimidine deaminase/5-amino-6-(5-phosphoribosylamino)uracil reductase
MPVDVVRVLDSKHLNSHQHFLKTALQLAWHGRGFSAPNPPVGAVIVRDNKIISIGFHRAAGLPHAEVEALQLLGDARDTSIYVTLEPCCHWGKTPPCTDLLIAKGVKQVYFGFADPNPKIKGKTKNILKVANILCEQINIPEIEAFYQSYAYWQQHQRPFITAKLAVSLDGKIAGFNGKPVKLTNELTDQFTHQQRIHSDAIFTTAVTVNNDNPQLNGRLDGKIIAKPIYVLDKQLSINLESQLFLTAKSVTLFHASNCDQHKLQQLRKKNIRCIALNADSHLSFSEIFDHIGKDGIHDLWIEAGGRLFSTLLAEGFVNRAYIYIAPKILGADSKSGFTASHFFERAKDISWETKGSDAICKINF